MVSAEVRHAMLESDFPRCFRWPCREVCGIFCYTEKFLEALAALCARNEFVSVNELAWQEREKAVAAVMRHMLFKNAKQPGVPTTRDELVGIVMAVVWGGGGQSSGSSRKFASTTSGVIEEARSMFPTLLGFEMKELQRVARGKGTALSQGEMEILSSALMLGMHKNGINLTPLLY